MVWEAPGVGKDGRTEGEGGGSREGWEGRKKTGEIMGEGVGIFPVPSTSKLLKGVDGWEVEAVVANVLPPD